MHFDASPRPQKGVCHLQDPARTSVTVDALPFGQIWFRSVTRVWRSGVLTEWATRNLPSSLNRSFTLTTGDSNPSRLRPLKNGLPQGSVLAPLLFNIYIYDLPSITSKKYVYTDDLAILYSSGDWKVLERTLSEDMTTLSAYLQTWRLKLSHAKTVTAAFHLHNRETKRELKVKKQWQILPFCPVPTYLGVKLNSAFTYCHHLEALCTNYPRAFRC